MSLCIALAIRPCMDWPKHQLKRSSLEAKLTAKQPSPPGSGPTTTRNTFGGFAEVPHLI